MRYTEKHHDISRNARTGFAEDWSVDVKTAKVEMHKFIRFQEKRKGFQEASKRNILGWVCFVPVWLARTFD